MLRIDFIFCWWENTIQPRLIGNMFIDVNDISYTITNSYSMSNWYIYNEFAISNNSIVFARAIERHVQDSGNGYEYQTANIYRVVGYK